MIAGIALVAVIPSWGPTGGVPVGHGRCDGNLVGHRISRPERDRHIVRGALGVHRFDISPLGYSVQRPSGWRRSDLQSRMTPKDNPDELAIETFTTRTPADQAEAMTHADTGIGPAQMYTAFVGLYRNSRSETAMAYAQRIKAGSGLVAVSIEPTRVEGRAGAKTTFKFTLSDREIFYTLYVPDGDRMWLIGYTLDSPIPPGATEPAARGIIESFKFAR